MNASPRAGRVRPGVVAFGVALAVVLGACSSKDKDKDEYVEKPVEELYNTGMTALMDERYDAASKSFDEVERQHPYSVWASKGQVMAAYSLYEAGKYDEAVITLDRFISLNPSSRDAPYAYYLKAISYYEQITDVQRDAKMTEFALSALDEVVRRFPESVYARDARLKIELAHDHLAGKEMEVARFYQTRQHYLGAVNRFKTVVDRYQTTSHVPEALHRLVECYMALGLQEQAQKTAAVLGFNYPGSDWYADSYALVQTGKDGAGSRGMMRRAFDSVF